MPSANKQQTAMRFMFKPLAFNSVESTFDVVVCCGHSALLVPKNHGTTMISPALEARPLAALQAMWAESLTELPKDYNQACTQSTRASCSPPFHDLSPQ